MSQISYTETYRLVYDCMKIDGIKTEVAQSLARRVTDAVWDLHLSLNFGDINLDKTIEMVKDIVDSKIKGQPTTNQSGDYLFSD